MIRTGRMNVKLYFEYFVGIKKAAFCKAALRIKQITSSSNAQYL